MRKFAISERMIFDFDGSGGFASGNVKIYFGMELMIAMRYRID
jgi:hypothetical protein